MAQQTINVGAAPNDGTGTPLRTAFQYTNSNFTELYTALGGGAGLPGATTQVIFNDGGTNLAGDAGLTYNKTTDALTVGGLLTAGSGSITGDLTVDTSTLKVDSANNRVGIGTATPAVTLDVAGGIQTPSGSAGGLFQFAYGASASSRSWRVWNDVSANGDLHISTSTTRTGSTYSDRYVVDVSANHFWYNTSGVTATLDSSGNLGLGIAPSAGGSNYYKTFELGKAGCGLFVATNTLTSSELTYLSGNGVLKYNAGPEWSYGNAGSAAIYGIEDGVHKWYNAGSGSAGGVFVPTQAMTLDASGNLALGNGNLVMSTSGKGIDFSATANSSGTMTSELLDDYEEGTWTGTLTGSVSNPTTPVTATGRYTKIGRVVTVQISFSNVNTTGASGLIGITGLPFANNGSVGTNGSVSLYLIATFTGSPFASIGVNESFINLYANNSGGAFTDVTHNAGASKYLTASVTYTV